MALTHYRLFGRLVLDGTTPQASPSRPVAVRVAEMWVCELGLPSLCVLRVTGVQTSYNKLAGRRHFDDLMME
jgi:hypothetical protein